MASSSTPAAVCTLVCYWFVGCIPAYLHTDDVDSGDYVFDDSVVIDREGVGTWPDITLNGTDSVCFLPEQLDDRELSRA